MLLGLVLAGGIAGSLPAEGVLPGERTAYDSMVVAQARAAFQTFSGACENAKAQVVAIYPWKILNQPDLIVWREKVRVTGCGHNSVENLNIGRTGGTPPWRISTGLPGDSLADMKLQQSTFPAAVAQARTGLPSNCQGPVLSDVYVGAGPGNYEVVPPSAQPVQALAGHTGASLPDFAAPMVEKLSLRDAWMEVWPFNLCGHDRTLGVVFVPLKDRTASVYFFLPIWQQIEAHGEGARPAHARPVN